MRTTLLLRSVVFGFALANAAVPEHARACEPASPARFVVSADPGDQTSPSTPVVPLASLVREGDGCGASAGVCGKTTIRLQLSATDDTTAANELGYVIDSSDPRVYGAGGPFQLNADGQVFLLVQGDAEDRDLHIELQVYAVDRAGNVSIDPAVVEVRDEGGCGVGRGASEGGAWMLGAVALLARRRRLGAR